MINADSMNNLKLINLNIFTDQAHTFPVKESAHLKHTRLDPHQICARMWKLFACDVYSACPQLCVWLKIAWAPMRLPPDFSHIWMLLPGQQSPPNGKDTENRDAEAEAPMTRLSAAAVVFTRVISRCSSYTAHLHAAHPAAGQQTMFSIVALV